MQPFLVVDQFEEATNVLVCFDEICILVDEHFLVLQGFDERFRPAVGGIVGNALAAHADGDAVSGEYRDVFV